MSGYELAELNIVLMKAPLDSSAIAEFVANLESINAMADASAGFAWREKGAATARRPSGDAVLVNMSLCAM